MAISPGQTYDRNNQSLRGTVDMGDVAPEDAELLANKILAFIFAGLTTNTVIPIAFFENKLTMLVRFYRFVHTYCDLRCLLPCQQAYCNPAT